MVKRCKDHYLIEIWNTICGLPDSFFIEIFISNFHHTQNSSLKGSVASNTSCNMCIIIIIQSKALNPPLYRIS